ncbi:MAG: acyl-CoA thioesterase, partial [Muribaculum sp.]|nr:acyl-CoA thioesterase [Muribaculum sp.]
INCDFYAPTFFNEEVGVVTTVTHVGEKSLNLEQRLICLTTGQVKTVCRTVMVGIDLATGHSAVVAREWVDAVSTFEGRKL